MHQIDNTHSTKRRVLGTLSLNTANKAKRLQKRGKGHVAARSWLRRTSPTIRRCSLLGVGFLKEALAAKPDYLSNKAVRKYLRMYTRHHHYLIKTARGIAKRYDLDGNAIGIVTEHESSWAKEQLSQIYEEYKK